MERPGGTGGTLGQLRETGKNRARARARARKETRSKLGQALGNREEAGEAIGARGAGLAGRLGGLGALHRAPRRATRDVVPQLLLRHLLGVHEVQLRRLGESGNTGAVGVVGVVDAVGVGVRFCANKCF